MGKLKSQTDSCLKSSRPDSRRQRVILAEVGLTTYWVENYDEDKNEEVGTSAQPGGQSSGDNGAKIGAISESHGKTLQLQCQT